MKPVLYETHSHTPLCKHATGEPEQYAAAAEARGLAGLVVTCHNPMPNGFSSRVRMAPEEFETYVELVQRAREQWAGQVDVRLGLEADYFPGYETWVERQLQSAPLHYVLGSVHPQTPEYLERFAAEDPLARQRTYFELLADAAETRLFDCLAHPDLIKNETAPHWNQAAVWDDILRALDRIAPTGVAMELNTSGANKTVPEMNPFPDMLQEIRRRSIPVVVGADAHAPSRVADRFEEALDLLSSCGFTHVSYFLNRQRQELPIPEARRSLQPRQDRKRRVHNNSS